MQRNGGHALLLCRERRFEIREVLIVNALAHLDGDRHVSARTLLDHRTHDHAEQVTLPGKRGAPTLAGHLGHGAAKVEVDVIGAILLHEDAGGLARGRGIDAVELDRAGALLRVVLDEAHRLGSALNESPSRDHFAHVEARRTGRATSLGTHRTGLAAQPSERAIRDASHGREDHRRRDGVATDLQRWQDGREGWRGGYGGHVGRQVGDQIRRAGAGARSGRAPLRRTAG